MLSKTPRSTIKRSANRASTKTEDLYTIIDELKMAHVCCIDGGQPLSIPMLCWRVDNHIFLHASRGSRLINLLASGDKCCLSFAELNGWVMAKSAFHHSANYRSAVVFGGFEVVEDEQQQMASYQAFVEQLEQGRWQQVRQPDQKELKATRLLTMPLTEASVKIRTGGPKDDPEDLALPVWAGEIPILKTLGNKLLHG